MKLPLFLINLLLVTTGFCQTTSIPVETGVSETLANYRRQALSNVRYRLMLDLSSPKEVRPTSSVTISFDLKKNENDLQVDFKEQEEETKSIFVNQKDVPVVFEKEHFIIDRKLLKAGPNVLTINYKASNLSLNRSDDYLYTLLVPDRARTLFPCFDQPDIKARFKLSLVLPKPWKALSNAALEDSVVSAESKVYNYKESDQISTYLFSFAAGRFERVSKTAGGRPMNFYHRETDTNKLRLSIDSVFRLHADALKFLEDYTQIPYPFKKFDFVAIPDFQYGGMEHVGAIQYRSSSLFLDSGATKDQQNARASLISHETSHMWFGDLVTMQWFNDVWMKEVFANFMADKITQGTSTSNNFDLKFLIDHFPAAYSVDRTPGANSIRQPLENLQDAGTLYGNIIYHKAPVMMRQLERLMTKIPFRDGLRSYLKKFQFGNATWPDLIQIMDAGTPADLQAWNKAWVNDKGRPVINYSIEEKNGAVAKFTLNSTTENGLPYLLPQFFEIAFVYPDRIEQHSINMNRQNMVLKELEGKQLPSYFLFNSTGQGYGLFPLDFNAVSHIPELKDPVMRASAYINAYENMLSGNVIKPMDLLLFYQNIVTKEGEELNLGLITRYLTDIYWRLITPAQRTAVMSSLENQLWQALQSDTVSNKKKILFRAYQNIAMTPNANERLYSIWKNQKPPTGVKLAEDDYTSLSLSLALKQYHADSILIEQLKRITNTDRRKRLEFLMPALSADVKLRDAFFASLKQEKNREKEAWVISALEYLHHPLRAASSIKYLGQTLELLQEIQMTGDIFFPYSWLQSSFGSYQSREAWAIVSNFLDSNRNYNPRLTAKILQATDPLFRATKLVGE